MNSLAQIVEDGALLSDAVMIARGGPATTIGMSTIKLRRLTELRVKCHPEEFVGECVPFFFCPRSIMLYLIYMGNHPELTYRGGQDRSCISRLTCAPRSHGLMPLGGVGRSRSRTPAPRTPSSGTTWGSWAKSTGRPWRTTTSARRK